jgi:hypothetical protein
VILIRHNLGISNISFHGNNRTADDANATDNGEINSAVSVLYALLQAKFIAACEDGQWARESRENNANV